MAKHINENRKITLPTYYISLLFSIAENNTSSLLFDLNPTAITGDRQITVINIHAKGFLVLTYTIKYTSHS